MSLRTLFRGASRIREEDKNRKLKNEMLELELKKNKLEQQKRDLQDSAFLDLVGQLAGKAASPQQEGPFINQQQEQALAAQPAKPGQTILEALSTPEGQASALKSGKLNIQQLASIRRKQGSNELLSKLTGDNSKLNIDPVSALVAQTTGDISKLKSGKTITQTVNTPEGPRLKVFTPGGKELSDLGQPKEKELSSEQAGKIAMLDQAVTDIDKGTQILFPKGQLDQRVLFEMASPGGGVGKGRAARSLFRNAMNAKLRAETGAQANPAELDDMEKRFMPSPLDLTSKGLPEMKVKRLREFMEGSLDITTLPKSLQAKIKKRRGKPQPKLGAGGEALPTGIPQGSKQIGTSKGKPVYETPDGKRLIVE